MLHAITIPEDAQVMAAGVTRPKVGSAKVVVKSNFRTDDTELADHEEAAYNVGMLMDVPVVPGFRYGSTWNSIFVEDLITVSDHLNAESRRLNKESWNIREQVEGDIIAGMDEGLRARITVFDYIIQNSDRHSGNWGLVSGGAIALFDHHCCFDTWKGTLHGEQWNVTREAVEAAFEAAREIFSPSLVKALLHRLPQDEIDFFLERVADPKYAEFWD